MNLAKQLNDFHLSIKDVNLPHDNWDIVNPLSNAYHLLEAYHNAYYSDNNPRDLIVGLNPGRKGANKTAIPFTDEHCLEEMLGLDVIPSEGRENTASRLHGVFREIGYDNLFSRFYMANCFPFGVVAEGKNIEFSKLIKDMEMSLFAMSYIKNIAMITKPEKIYAVGKKAEKFCRQHLELPTIYLHHPARVFPQEKRDEYLLHLSD